VLRKDFPSSVPEKGFVNGRLLRYYPLPQKPPEVEMMNERLRETAIQCVQNAGAIVLEYYGKLHHLHVQAKGRFDYVTEADLAAQEAIVKLIRRRHPDHDILAEEAGDMPGRSTHRWLVDPLDGTTNFIHTYPVFAVSVALEREGAVVVGAVYDPCRRELFVAEQGKGATLNGRPLAVSTVEHPRDALVATGFPFRDKSVLARYLQAFARIFTEVSGMRRAGSAALDLAYLACGRCDGFWEVGLSPWDIAAGDLLVREAGGIISDFAGTGEHIRVGDVIAATPGIYNFLLGTVRDVFHGNVSAAG
jgi:myo-inositol-1(or 4)-monophosphatase